MRRLAMTLGGLLLGGAGLLALAGTAAAQPATETAEGPVDIVEVSGLVEGMFRSRAGSPNHNAARVTNPTTTTKANALRQPSV